MRSPYAHAGACAKVVVARVCLKRARVFHPTVGAVRRKPNVEKEKQKADHRSARKLGRRSLVDEHELMGKFQYVRTSGLKIKPRVADMMRMPHKIWRPLSTPKYASTSVVMRILRPISTDSHHLFATNSQPCVHLRPMKQTHEQLAAA